MREKSCTSTFVAAKTLPRYLPFREDFANGGGPLTHKEPVLQRSPSVIEPGGLEGEGFESGLQKMGIEGGGSLMS